MSKVKITGKVLVIQLGREETRIVLVGKSNELLRTITLETPADAVEDGVIRNPDAVRDMLKGVLKDDPELKRTRQVVFSLRTSQMITEEVVVPDLPAAKTEKLIQSNMDTYFPVDVHDCRVVWQTLSTRTEEDGSKKQCIQLWAVPRALLGRYYKVANDCGLSVAAVDYCGNSLATAAGISYAVKEAKAEKKSGLNMELGFGAKKKKEEPAAAAEEASSTTATRTNPSTNLYVSLDKDLLGMTFAQNGRVIYQRFVRCGADPMQQFGELAMMVEYYHTLESARGSTIRGVVVGGLADDDMLVADLQDMLGIPLSHYRGESAPGLVFCVGAARTTMDFGDPSMNKVATAGSQVRTDLWQYGVILAGGLAMVGVVIMLMSARLVWSMDISSLNTTKQALQVQASKVAGFADNYYAYERNYSTYDADWETVFSSLRTYNDNLVLMLGELEDIMPENSSVTNMQIAADGMVVTFACANKEEAAFLIMQLRELKYANLYSISNLSGGGGGPATSYGSGEQAPTEGSNEGIKVNEPRKKSAIGSLIASELSDEEIMSLVKDLSDEERDQLREVYGKTPGSDDTKQPNYSGKPRKLESLKELYEDKPVAEQNKLNTARADAVRALLTDDPFAADQFLELLEEDFDREEDALLWWVILDDLARLKQQGKLDVNNIEDVAALQKHMDILVDVLVQDEDHLAATENLFCTDTYMENSYLYYLEDELGMRQADDLPWLDVDKVLDDMLTGGFNTGDSKLDKKLDAMISDQTWDLMDSLDTDAGRKALLENYFSKGTTGNVHLDAIVGDYLTTGTTGSDEMDRIVNDFLNDDNTGDILGNLMNSYLDKGTTGNPTVDQLVTSYLDKGTTGNTRLDEIMSDFVENTAKGMTPAQVTDLLNKYTTQGTTGNAVYDSLLGAYLTKGTTGIPALDAVIKDSLNNLGGSLENLTQAQLNDLMNKYLEEGTTGNPALDDAVLKYVNNGTTGNANLDKLFKEFLSNMANADDPTAGLNEEKLNEMMQKYLSEGTTGNPMFDALIFKYITTGSTGIPEVDKMIMDYLANMGVPGGPGNNQNPDGGFTKEQVAEMLEEYLEKGTTGNDLYDQLIEKYLTTGTTGNPELDKLIKDYMKDMDDDPAFTKDQVADMLEKYLEKGTTGNPVYDKLIEKYLNEGTTGNSDLDDMIEDYMKDLLGGSGEFTPELIKDLMNKYLENGTTGNATFDKLIYKFITEGTTGLKDLDKMIMDYLNSLAGNQGPSGGIVTGPTGPILDTRIYFTVALGYKEDLKNAELARKGLYYDDKISKLEVEE